MSSPMTDEERARELDARLQLMNTNQRHALLVEAFRCVREDYDRRMYRHYMEHCWGETDYDWPE